MMYKIKTRPVVFLITILIFLISGFLISGCIERKATTRAKKFEETNLLIFDSTRFMNLRNGVFIAEGKLKVLDPQTAPGLEGRYMVIELQEEEHRVYPKVSFVPGENGGKIPKTVSTYGTWTTIRTEKLLPDSLEFLGRSIGSQDIDFKYYLGGYALNQDNKFRTTYRTYPEETEIGLLYGNCIDGKLSGLKFVEGKTIAGEQLKLAKKIKRQPRIFWIIWIILGLNVAAGLPDILSIIIDTI